VAFTHELPGDSDIFVVRTNAVLAPLEIFIPIDVTGTPTDHPSITSFSDGSLFVVYTIQNSATDWDILARRVDSAGNVSAAQHAVRRQR
jgi:hypothetical protein